MVPSPERQDSTRVSRRRSGRSLQNLTEIEPEVGEIPGWALEVEFGVYGSPGPEFPENAITEGK